MIITKTVLTAVVMVAASTLSAKPTGNLKDAKKIAEEFIEVVDKNDAEALTALLHPDMLQYVNFGESLIPFKAADFIIMVAEKKIGGTPRSIKHVAANIIRNGAAYVVLQAVSHEYDLCIRSL